MRQFVNTARKRCAGARAGHGLAGHSDAGHPTTCGGDAGGRAAVNAGHARGSHTCR